MVFFSSVPGSDCSDPASLRGVSLAFHTAPLTFLRLTTQFRREKELGVLAGGSNRVDLIRQPASTSKSFPLSCDFVPNLDWVGTVRERTVPSLRRSFSFLIAS